MRSMKLSREESHNYGLLVLRVGVGLMFVFVYGLSKVLGGVPMWSQLGGAFTRLVGLDFFPAFWGFIDCRRIWRWPIAGAWSVLPSSIRRVAVYLNDREPFYHPWRLRFCSGVTADRARSCFAWSYSYRPRLIHFFPAVTSSQSRRSSCSFFPLVAHSIGGVSYSS